MAKRTYVKAGPIELLAREIIFSPGHHDLVAVGIEDLLRIATEGLSEYAELRFSFALEKLPSRKRGAGSGEIQHHNACVGQLSLYRAGGGSRS